MIKGFQDAVLEGPVGPIAYSEAGRGTPIIMLHGFPQTRAMWHGIAPALAQDFRVICPDLRGYGASAKPKGVDHYSFREMGKDILALMDHLGIENAHLVGHDSGARVSHRLALDAGARFKTLTLMDIVPTHTLFANLSRDVALGYYHWFFLAMAEPLPDRMIAHDPDAYYMSCLTGWGTGTEPNFDPAALDHYKAAWRDPETIRAMCDDYRAGATLDFELDATDLDARITCPALVLFAKGGMMDKAYDMRKVWGDKINTFQAHGLLGGHFFPDHYPEQTLTKLRAFLDANSNT
jgi:haloacetate dehalogenase